MIRERKTLISRLRKHFAQCLVDHAMITSHDRILLALSGGKDSWALLRLFSDFRARCPFEISLEAVCIDAGFVDFQADFLEEECEKHNVPFRVVKQDIFETVWKKRDPGSMFCSLCSKLRRGVLYSLAQTLHATKIALGHHLDDAIETLLLNVFYSGRSAALPPVLLSNAGHVPIIRPLLYCAEKDLQDFAVLEKVRIHRWICPVCKEYPEGEKGDLTRQKVKQWVEGWAKEHPQLREQARSALKKLEPTRFFDMSYSQKGTG